MSESPLISLVIPVRNGEAHLDRCLAAVRELDWPRDRLEVIVVDNGSRDRSVEIAESHGATVLREARAGAGNARNTGWRAAKGELIAFTDCDCEPSAGWLSHLVPAFDDSEVAAAGGHLAPGKPSSAVEDYIVARGILTQERAMRDDPISPPFLVTANAMYRRAALDQAGGFDPELPIAGEDADLAWRLRWRGWKIRLIPDAVVTHHHRSTVRGLMRQMHGYGRGSTHLFAKHRERLGFRRFTLKEPYVEALRGLVLSPFKLLFGRDRLDRWSPLLDFLAMSSFICGKLSASVRLRVWNV